MAERSVPELCRWLDLHEALERFVLCAPSMARTDSDTSSRCTGTLRVGCASRVGSIRTRLPLGPPFACKPLVVAGGGWRILEHVPECGGTGELILIGGLKTKQVDVVVTIPDIGPVIAVSIKGTLNAFRNLTNRLEEAGGDCTNLHISHRT